MPDYVEWDGVVEDELGDMLKAAKEEGEKKGMQEGVARVGRALDLASKLIEKGASLKEVEEATGLKVSEFPILQSVYKLSQPMRTAREKSGDVGKMKLGD